MGGGGYNEMARQAGWALGEEGCSGLTRPTRGPRGGSFWGKDCNAREWRGECLKPPASRKSRYPEAPSGRSPHAVSLAQGHGMDRPERPSPRVPRGALPEDPGGSERQFFLVFFLFLPGWGPSSHFLQFLRILSQIGSPLGTTLGSFLHF